MLNGLQFFVSNEIKSSENIWREVFSSRDWVLPTPAVSRSPWHRRATLAQGALTMIRAKCQGPGTSVERYNEVQNELCHIFSSITLQTLIQGQCH